MKIYVKESTLVAPVAETPRLSLWSSNLDLLISNFHMASVFYRANGEADFFEAATLKAALSRVLVHFHPMAGRLKVDEDGRLEIDCNAKGALFVEAECDASLDDLGDFAPTEKLSRLVPTVDYSRGISHSPLSLVQVTRFSCGGVCLGVANQHNVVDGYAGLNFINSWSRVARGLDIVTPPFLDRTLLAARNPSRPQFDHIEYTPFTPTSNPISPDTAVSMFKLTHDHLKKLKSKFPVVENKVAPTSYEMLASHIWRCACAARLQPDGQETRLYIAVDGRTRLRPPLPQGYLGNVIFSVMHSRLSEEPVWRTAGGIHDALARMDDEYLRSALDFLEVQDDLKALVRDARTYGNPNIGITSWARLPIYEADFGWGKPFFMGPAWIPFEGLCYVLGSATNDGGLTVVIRLEKTHMELFGKKLFEI